MLVFVCFFASAIFGYTTNFTHAAPNYHMNYQGKLTNASNVAVANGTYNMRFWLLTSSSIATTSAVWTETLTGTNRVTVTNGLFSVMLGSTSPLTGVDFNQTLYLGVEIGGTSTPAWDGEMSPRKTLGTVPAAFEAKNAGTLSGLATTSFLRSDQVDTASSLLTFTGGLISNASSTITNLTTLIATTTTLVVNGESFNDLTGSGLKNTTNALTCETASGLLFGCLTSTDWSTFMGKVASSSIDTLAKLETFQGGINIIQSTEINTSALLAGLLSDETGSGLAVFGTNPLLSGFRSNASSTIGDGTATGGLTVYGNSTTTGNAYFAGNVGIGTTSPSARLSLVGVAGLTNLFAFASSTSSNLLTLNTRGALTFGTTTNASIFINGGGTTTQTHNSQNNVAIGNQAFSYYTAGASGAINNIAMGYQALYGSSTLPMTGDNNIALGYQALNINSSGYSNIALGNSTLLFNSGGNNNIAIGDNSLKQNTQGQFNTAIGKNSMLENITGEFNNAVGYDALGYNTIGTYNNAFGESALLNNISGWGNAAFGSASQRENYFGSYNSSLGFDSLKLNFSSYNAALGYRAGYTNTIGTSTTFLGAFADATLTDLSTSTAIGAGAKVGCSNCLVLGGTGLNAVNVGIGTSNPSFALEIQGSVATGFGAIVQNSSDTGWSRQVVSNDFANSLEMRMHGSAVTGTVYGVSNNNLALFQASGVSSFVLGTDISSPVILGTNNTERIRITGAGNVGIGTSTPNHPLTVQGNINISAASGAIYFDDTKYIYASSTNDSIAFGENAGATFNSLTTYNVALGFDAGRNASTSFSDYNNFIGYQAGYLNTGGNNNLIGTYAGFNNTGSYNNIFGATAGTDNTGYYNNLIGEYAGRTNTGIYNNLIGDSAGYNNRGDENNIIGDSAGYNNTGGHSNIIGTYSGNNNSGSYNNFIGDYSGYTNTGNYNEMFGFETGRYLRSTSSILVGAQAFRGISAFTAINNTAIGYQAGYNAATGADNNILLGYRAADNLTTGNNNIVIGYDIDLTTATSNNTLNIGNLIFGTGLDGTGTTLAGGNVGIGTSTPSSKLTVQGSGTTNLFNFVSSAGTNLLSLTLDGVLIFNTPSDYPDIFINGGSTTTDPQQFSGNIGIGNETLSYLDNTGVNNVAIGNMAGFHNTTGDENTFISTNAGFNNTTGYRNIFIGNSSGYYGQTNDQSVIIGDEAGYYINDGLYNEFIGSGSGYSVRSGWYNFMAGGQAGVNTRSSNSTVFLGSSAGRNVGTSTGNTYLGVDAGGYGSNSTSTNNTLVGFSAGRILSNATGNLFLGYKAASSSSKGDYNILLGYDIALASTTGSNQLNIGNLIYGTGLGIGGAAATGNIGIGSTTPSARLTVQGASGSTANLFRVASSTGSTLFSVLSSGIVNIFSGTSTQASTTNIFVNGGTTSITPLRNIAQGFQAFTNVTTGANDNIALGYQSLFGSSTVLMNGYYNIAQGYQSLFSNTWGSHNIAQGNQALFSNTGGFNNLAQGDQTLFSNTSGFNNIAIGPLSLFKNTTGYRNIALGETSMFWNTSGSDNTGIGQYTLNSNTTGYDNIAIGAYTLESNTTGNYNAALGRVALALNSTGSYNSALGNRAGYNNTVGTSTTFLGSFSDATANNLSTSTAIGAGALVGCSNCLVLGGTGSNYARVGIGTSTPSSMLSVTGNGGSTNLFAFASSTGSNLLTLNARGALTFGTTTNASIFINGGGTTAQTHLSQNNVAIGNGAYSYHSSGATDNVAFGYQALYGSVSTLMTGDYNFAVGNSALYSNTTGSYNTAIGVNTLYGNTTGSSNQAIGDGALQWNESGSHNVAFGESALFNNNFGSNNTAIGDSSLLNYYGTGTIAIGYKAGSNLDNGNRNIIIGYNNDFANASTSFGLNIGNLIYGTNVNGEGSTLSTGNIGIGTTTPSSRLTVQGVSGSTVDLFRVASSTGSTSLAVIASGDIEVTNNLITAGIKWTSRTSAADNSWQSITYGNGLFVAVGGTGTSRIMTSPDGVTWSTSTAAAANYWVSVTYGNGLFVAVASNAVMTSPDGITWTSRTSATSNSWQSVTYGNGLFVAVASNAVMTSPDGITWTSRTSATNSWQSVTYGNGLFVAVSTNGVGNRVMTSPDGITWTSQTSADDNTWYSVTYGNGLFVAVGWDGVMTSPNGINWTNRPIPSTENSWYSVTYGNGLFVAVSDFDYGYGSRVMTSPDGINWTRRAIPVNNEWSSVTYGNGLFVAVSWNGTGNRVMTSGKSFMNALVHNNVYQGGMTIFDSLRVGTTTNTAALFVQSRAGITPLTVASSSGSTLFSVLSSGIVNIFSGTSTQASTTNIFINGGTTSLTPLRNIAQGFQAFTNVSTANDNIALGYQALFGSSTVLMTGDNNIAQGYQALFSNTIGSNNIAQGSQSLFSNTTGGSNIAQGNSSLYNNTTGGFNIALGNSSLYDNTTGSDNIAIGRNAGLFLGGTVSSYKNIFLGYQAGDDQTQGDYNIAIGNSGDFASSTGSNQLNIGNLIWGTGLDGTGTTISTGNIGIGTTTPSARLSVTGNGGFTNLFAFASSTGSNLLTLNARGALTFGTTTNASIFINGGGTTAQPQRSENNIAIGNESFSYYATNANDNIAFGYQALQGSSTLPMYGYENIAIGRQSLNSVTYGGQNIAIGSQALLSNESGGNNIAIGMYALIDNTSGYTNIAIGEAALSSNTSGDWNTALGENALRNNMSGTHNVAVGKSAIYNNIDGKYNTGSGYNSLFANTTGYRNTAFGAFAGSFNTVGTSTSFFGYGADATLNNLSTSTAIGAGALVGCSNCLVLGGTGSNYVNVGIGTSTPTSILSVTGNGGSTNLFAFASSTGSNLLTLKANGALTFGTTTSANISINGGATSTLTQTNSNNIAIGNDALSYYTSSGQYNIALGHKALHGSSSVLMTGDYNVALGDYALFDNTTGSDNFAVGSCALCSNTSGFHNMAVGDSALVSNISGGDNIAIGKWSLLDNTIGNGNISMGYESMTSNINGNYNIGLGQASLASNLTGNYNTGFGMESLISNTSGNYNTALGVFSGVVNTTGKSNSYLGYLADATLNNLSTSTAIGAGAKVGCSNCLVLGGTGSNYARVGIGTTTPSSMLSVTGNGGSTNLFAFASSTGSNLLTLNARGALTFGTTTNANILINGGATSTRVQTNQNNIAIGNQAFSYYSSTASDNVAIGYQALFGSTTALFAGGDNNVAIGSLALRDNNGNNNTAVGSGALRRNTEGWYNSAFGRDALGFNLTGDSNIAFGEQALQVNESGNDNIGIGSYSLSSNETGNFNIGLGNNVLSSYQGTGTIAIGYQAGNALTSGNRNIIIGYNNDFANASTSFGLNIGNLIYGTNVDGEGSSVSSGNIGIGTSTPSARLTIDKAGFGGAGVAGMKQYFGFTNSVASALYYGDETYIVNAPTATSTLIGKMIRIQDDTTLGNTVRGFEAQAHRGTNTKGENTGLSGFGRTFGVRGTTIGDAGSTYLPAGVYAESQGTAQGNALRAYSGTLTTETLVSLFHDTSAFIGTGLEMNFGNAGGSFVATSSSAKFLDFQVAGVSKFIVAANGSTTIGDGTVNASLRIPFGGICVDNDGSCVSTTTGQIRSVSSALGNSDLAEMYFSNQTLQMGEIVSLTGGLSVGRAEDSSEETIIGVVSTKPGITLGFDDTSLKAGETSYPIGLKGRVPVKLSIENGPIKKGDRITISSIPGIGMKATESSRVVGIALEDYDGTRAYSAGFLNQFGDDMIKERVTNKTIIDPKTQDGCYHGAGAALGEEGCTPDKVKKSETIVTTTSDNSEYKTMLATLTNKSAQHATMANGESTYIGQVTMFIELTWYQSDTEKLVLSELMSTSTLLDAQDDETVWSRLKQLAQGFVDGVLTLAGIKAEEVQTDRLCVGNRCINEAEFIKILDGINTNETITEPQKNTDNINTDTTTIPDQPVDIVTETPIIVVSDEMGNDPIVASDTEMIEEVEIILNEPEAENIQTEEPVVSTEPITEAITEALITP